VVVKVQAGWGGEGFVDNGLHGGSLWGGLERIYMLSNE
jgi:hypothetical protein